MKAFDEQLQKSGKYPLRADEINTLQVNTGYKCNLRCNHCHVEASPDRSEVESAYKEKLKSMHGAVFNKLIALSNMPIGRLGKSMKDDEKAAYLKELGEKFNPDTVDNLMCRHLVSISHDGRIFDCDFWQMLNIPVNNGCATIDTFDHALLSKREINTNNLCLMCTAGAGASCGGSLA
jgi:MoaA/NifB/PqqE/SkfB family radical SAM enzyme